jgi:hypothetical protein
MVFLVRVTIALMAESEFRKAIRLFNHLLFDRNSTKKSRKPRHGNRAGCAIPTA